MRAIGLTVAALRGIERWGSSDMLERTFGGFAALPEQSSTGWWQHLGIPRESTLEQIQVRWRELVKVYHPDHGGTPQRFQDLMEAFEQAKKEKAGV